MLALLVLTATVGHAGTQGAFSYADRGDAIAITGCDPAASGILAIPEMINNKPVTSIESRAFRDCGNITALSLPSGLTQIGSYAFSGCDGVKNMTVPASVVSIGSFAFSCDSLIAINIDGSNANYADIDGVLFNKACTALIYYPLNKQGAYLVPETVQTINNYAFCWCAVASIHLPESVTTINEMAFFDCDQLNELTVETSSPFFSSTGGVLFNKDQSELIRCPTGMSGTYTIPQTVHTIRSVAFKDCTQLTSISLPSSVQHINYRAFGNCDGLHEISLPDGLLSLGKWAFYSSGNLTAVEIPRSVNTIGDAPFAKCSNLESIAVDPANEYFTTVDSVLYDIALTKLIECPYRKAGTVAIPDSVREIGYVAFLGCDLVTNVIFPHSLEKMNYGAFAYCDGLKAVTLPQHLSSMDKWSFYKCTALSTATFMGDAPVTGEDIFFSADSDFSVFYYNYNTGFSSPEWKGYPAQVITDTRLEWLQAHGFPADTEMWMQDLNGDGVNLLTAYALNLDPYQNQSGNLPSPTIDTDNMSIRFYAAASGIAYIVEASTDLKTWSANDVTWSNLDEENYTTAFVPLTSPCCFLRLRFRME